MTPQITTIIPTYRRPKLLKRAIESVLNQTYPHIQLLILDNQSNDETKELVYEMMKKDARIIYHCHKTNIGANANFQFGLEQVKTPYFSFLSDDDFLLPRFYETTLEGFKRFPEIGFCAGACLYVNEKHEVKGMNPRFHEEERYFSAPQGVLEILDGAIPLWTSILFKTSILSKIGHLNVSTLAIDIDFVARVTLYFPYFVKKISCAVFVRHPGTISSQKNLEILYPSIYQVILGLKNQPSIPADCLASFEQMLIKRLKILLLKLARSHIEEGDFAQALQIAEILQVKLLDKKMGFLLLACVNFCRKTSFAYQLFLFLSKTYRTVRTLFRRWNAKELQLTLPH